MTSILNIIPNYNPYLVVIAFVIIPPVLFSVSLLAGTGCTKNKDGYWNGLKVNTIWVLFNLAPLIAILCILWSIVICAVQGAYLYRNGNLATDLTYYLQVDIPEYSVVDLINLAETSYSANTYYDQIMGYDRRRRRLQRNSRKLDTSQTDSLGLIYHMNDWSDMLSEENMILACQTEQNIRTNMPCIDFSSGSSLLAAVFYMNSCTFQVSYESALATFADSENSEYVQDNLNPNDPVSAIISSIFNIGSCTSNVDDFNSEISAQSSGGVEITFLSTPFITSSFEDAIYNGAYLSAIALAASAIYIFLSVRGIIVTIVTIFSILVSIINAAAVLTDFHYQSFSAFNVLSVFILIGVGGNSVVMFGSAWRDRVKLGMSPTSEDMVTSYSTIGAPVLFTICAATISLFSKLISPVVVISQLGAFMGVCVVVFYVCFHFMIIPTWIFTGWFHFPRSWYEAVFRFFNGLTGRNNGGDDTNHIELSADIGKRGFDLESDHSGSLNEEDPEADTPPVAQEIRTSSFYRHSLRQQTMFATVIEMVSNPSGGGRTDSVRMQALPVVNEGDVTPDSTPQNNKGRKWLLKLFGLFLLLVTFAGFYLVYYFSVQKYDLDLGIPQLFPPESDMGQIIYIVQNYKSTLLTSFRASTPTVVTPSGTASPSNKPVLSPSRSPSFTNSPSAPFSSASPTTTHSPALSWPPSHHPTAPLPTASAVPSFSLSPTLSPSIVSASPTTTMPSYNANNNPDSSESNVAYTVSTCWGLTVEKQYIDSVVEVGLNVPSFQVYLNHGFIHDLYHFCNYVNINRLTLNIHPDWIMTRDCIYYQYNASYYSLPPASRNVTNAFLNWALNPQASSTPRSLLGVQQINASAAWSQKNIEITWLCANFSALTNVSSLLNHAQVAVNLESKWETALNDYGSTYATEYDVNTCVGSNAFSFPLLATEVLYSIELAIIISVAGFFGLLIFFTYGDAGIVLLGTLGMIAIFAVAICLHLYFFSATFDLLDVVVLIAIIGIVVDSPIHVIMHYIQEKNKLYQARRRGEESEYLRLQESDTVVAISKPLHDTNVYMRLSLIQVLILTGIAGIPLLFATFVLLQKTGQYVVIIALVSYFYCIFFLPYIIAFSCRTHFFDSYCYRLPADPESSPSVEEVPSSPGAPPLAEVVGSGRQEQKQANNDDVDDDNDDNDGGKESKESKQEEESGRSGRQNFEIEEESKRSNKEKNRPSSIRTKARNLLMI